MICDIKGGEIKRNNGIFYFLFFFMLERVDIVIGVNFSLVILFHFEYFGNTYSFSLYPLWNTFQARFIVY